MTSQQQQPQPLTRAEAAKRLGLSLGAVTNLIAAGKLRRASSNAARPLIDAESVAEFQASRRRRGAPIKNTLHHYTVPTGHTRQCRRSEVHPQVLEQLRPLLKNGRHKMPIAGGYTLLVSIEGNCLLATVFCGERPCVSVGVAPDAEASAKLWPIIERGYLEALDAIKMQPGQDAAARHPLPPNGVPWCAAYLVLATPAEAYWIADFERCLAWAWIEKVRAKKGKKRN